MTEPTITRLSSGYTLIWFNAECWAQIPPGTSLNDPIDDKYIFHPSWNWRRINDWWRGQRTGTEAK